MTTLLMDEHGATRVTPGGVFLLGNLINCRSDLRLPMKQSFPCISTRKGYSFLGGKRLLCQHVAK